MVDTPGIASTAYAVIQRRGTGAVGVLTTVQALAARHTRAGTIVRRAYGHQSGYPAGRAATGMTVSGICVRTIAPLTY